MRDQPSTISPEQHVTDLVGQEGVVTHVSGEYAYVVSGMWCRVGDLIPIDQCYFGDPRTHPTPPLQVQTGPAAHPNGATDE